jgi:hypothetical protein
VDILHPVWLVSPELLDGPNRGQNKNKFDENPESEQTKHKKHGHAFSYSNKHSVLLTLFVLPPVQGSV